MEQGSLAHSRVLNLVVPPLVLSIRFGFGVRAAVRGVAGGPDGTPTLHAYGQVFVVHAGFDRERERRLCVCRVSAQRDGLAYVVAPRWALGRAAARGAPPDLGAALTRQRSLRLLGAMCCHMFDEIFRSVTPHTGGTHRCHQNNEIKPRHMMTAAVLGGSLGHRQATSGFANAQPTPVGRLSTPLHIPIVVDGMSRKLIITPRDPRPLQQHSCSRV